MQLYDLIILAITETAWVNLFANESDALSLQTYIYFKKNMFPI